MQDNKDQKKKPFVVRWREAILSPEGPAGANTRLVLLALSMYMNDDGENCFPSSRSVAEDTSLTRKTVEVHLRAAESNGWVSIVDRKLPGQKWRRHGYIPLLKGGVAATPPNTKGGVNDGKRWSNSRPKGGVAATPELDHITTHELEGATPAPAREAKPKTKLTLTDLVDDYGVDRDLAAEFLQIRKDKRQTLTPTAWKRLCDEFTKAGLTLHDGLQLCCERAWAGFKASWSWRDDGDRHASDTGRTETTAARNMRRNEALARGELI